VVALRGVQDGLLERAITVSKHDTEVVTGERDRHIRLPIPVEVADNQSSRRGSRKRVDFGPESSQTAAGKDGDGIAGGSRDQVRPAIPVNTSEAGAIAGWASGDLNGGLGRGLKASVTFAEQNGNRVNEQRVGTCVVGRAHNMQVAVSIKLSVSERHATRHRVHHGLLEGPIAIAKKHVRRRGGLHRSTVGHGQIQLAVSVEIRGANGQRGVSAAGERSRLAERAIPQAQQNGDLPLSLLPPFTEARSKFPSPLQSPAARQIDRKTGCRYCRSAERSASFTEEDHNPFLLRVSDSRRNVQITVAVEIAYREEQHMGYGGNPFTG
jgi:hypothetical protein